VRKIISNYKENSMSLEKMFDKIKDSLEKSKEKSQTKDFGNTYWFKDGRTVIRILPKHKEQGLIYTEGKRHYNLGPNQRWSEICPASFPNLEEACPICEKEQELLATGEKADKEAAKKYHASKKFWFPGIVRGEEDKGVLSLECAETLWRGIVNCLYIAEDDDEVDMDAGPYVKFPNGQIIFDFTNLKKGRDFVVTRSKGEGQRTEYSVAMKEVNKKAGPLEAVKEWMSAVVNLDEYIPSICRNYEELKHLLEGETPVEEVSSDEDNTEDFDLWDKEEDTGETTELNEDDFELDEDGNIVPKKKKRGRPPKAKTDSAEITASIKNRLEKQRGRKRSSD
jgi:hypothetical protein